MSTDFQCLCCGACCRHAGEVRLAEGEADAIAAALGLDVGGFTARYAALRSDRRGLSLQERSDGACIFLEDDPPRCAVQAVKPAQCRGFPTEWRYRDAHDTCAALSASSLAQVNERKEKDV